MERTDVYLIDNEPVMLDLLCEVVEQAGLNPHGFTRGSQFFEQCDDIVADSILVLDLHMPEMDGIEVMRRLAKMADPPSLILVSGHDIGVLHAAETLGRAVSHLTSQVSRLNLTSHASTSNPAVRK